MRISSLCGYGSLLVAAAVLQACSGDSFEPGAGPAAAGKAGASTGGTGGTSSAGGKDAGAGTTANAGSGGTETAAGAGGTGGTSDGGTGGTEAGGTGGTEAGGTDAGGKGGANAGGKGGTNAGGKGGTNAGGKGGSAGNGSAANAGAGGAAGGDGGAGQAGSAQGGAGQGGAGQGGAGQGGAGQGGEGLGGFGIGGAPLCDHPASCGDGKIEGLDQCDISSCDDEYCTQECTRTDAAKKRYATELCIQGVCWMFVDYESSARNGSTQAKGSCDALNAGPRTWSLAWFSTEAERLSLVAAAAQFLPSTANQNVAWIGPVYVPKQGWTQPDAPITAGKAPLPPPGNTESTYATKVLVEANAAKIVTSDPSSGMAARAICRAN